MHGLGHAMAVWHNTGEDCRYVAAAPAWPVASWMRVDWAAKTLPEWAALRSALSSCAALLGYHATLRTPLVRSVAREHAAACSTGAWMEYQTEKGNPFPLCIDLDCANESSFPFDCWNRHWEGCRRSILVDFGDAWHSSNPRTLQLAPHWAKHARGCNGGEGTVENGQFCMSSFGQWLSVAIVNANEFEPPMTEWHLHRVVDLCEAPEGWELAYKSFRSGHKRLPGTAAAYATACAGGAYSFWKEKSNGGREHPAYANATWCTTNKDGSVPSTCKFWAPSV